MKRFSARGGGAHGRREENGMEKKTVRVAAAAVIRDGRVLLCRRGYGDLKGLWEFPGGKCEPGETPRETAVREIMEELKIRIEPGELLCRVVHDYPLFRLDMDVFTAVLPGGEPVATEHEGILWADMADLERLRFCPADVKAAERLKAYPGLAGGKTPG